MKLRYRDDNTFTIIQFTDTHFGNKPYDPDDFKSFDLLEKAWESFDADLIVHTGDIMWTDGVKNADIIFGEVMDAFDKSGMPFIFTFGNHDAEGEFSRQHLWQVYDDKITLKPERKHIHNHDNREAFVLEILDNNTDEVRNVLYLIDSGIDTPIKGLGTYDWIQPEQVEWFRKTSKIYRKGDNVKRNLVFQHIPLPEYWQAKDNIIGGKCLETISAPVINTGLFANMVLDGETWGMFCGHDHENDYHGQVHGLNLVYGKMSGFQAYGEIKRGVRLIKLNKEKMTIDTSVVEIDDFKG